MVRLRRFRLRLCITAILGGMVMFMGGCYSHAHSHSPAKSDHNAASKKTKKTKSASPKQAPASSKPASWEGELD